MKVTVYFISHKTMLSEQIREIQKRLFEATVPIRFTIPKLNVPLCFNANRAISLGYFAYNFLGYFIDDQEDLKDMWFCSEGQPIKWQLPLGLIYDIFRPSKDDLSPLNIELHFDNFPEGKVLRCDSFQTVKQMFNHSFKESCFLAYSNNNLVQANTNIRRKIAKSVIDKDYSKFLPLFELHTKNVSTWKMWPIKLVDKEFNITNDFMNVEEGQTLRSALEFKGIKPDRNVTIQGIDVPLETPLKDLMSAMMYPDGFLYASTN